jgi:hypothetical protein
LNGVLTKGVPLAGETFPTISAQEATKFGATTQLFQFGTNPPVAVIKYEGKTYYHITKDPVKPDTGKHASMKAKKQRCEAITKARDLLKSNERLHAKQFEQVFNDLHNVTYKLSISMHKARSSGNANTARNYRRKRRQVKGLCAALTNRVIQDTRSEEEPHGSVYLDPVETPYVLSVKAERPHELKQLIRDAIMNEFWTRTMNRPAHFPGCKPLPLLQSTMLVSVNHITTNDNTKNRFATLPNEVPTPHSDDLQRQFQQLQAQMMQLQQQLQGHEEGTHAGGRPSCSHVNEHARSRPIHSHENEHYIHAGGRPSRPYENYTRTGGGSMHRTRDRYHEEPESSRQTNMRQHIPSYRPQYDQRTLAPRRGSHQYFKTRHASSSSHVYQQARQEWRPVSPRREQHQGEPAITFASRGQEGPMPPPQRPTSAPTQIATTSSSQQNRSLLPTPSIQPITAYVPSVNKRKRENRRNNRRVLYQELQELVLNNVRVKVRPEGQVHPFYDKIMLRLSPALKQNERYRYLVERLVPKPKKLQENTQTITPEQGVGFLKPEAAVMEVDTKNSIKEKSEVFLKEIEQTKAQQVTSLQDLERKGKEILQNTEDGDHHMKDADNMKGADNDVVLCGTLSALSEQSDDPKWAPPQVTHEFSYPSDEEIVPNPKASYSKRGLLPNLGKVRKWFRGSNDQDDESDMKSSTAPCLPVTSKNSTASGRSRGGLSPHHYINVESRLPQDNPSLEIIAQREGVSTRLKMIASQKIACTSPHVNNESVEEEESNGDSSTSLEERPGSPHYSEPAHSIVSDDDTEEGNLYDAPANVIIAGDKDKEKDSGAGVSGTKNDMSRCCSLSKNKLML